MSNKIQDEFTNLPVSRERKRQLRKQKLGLCVDANCNKPAFFASRCVKGQAAERERARKRTGCVKRYKGARSYHQAGLIQCR